MFGGLRSLVRRWPVATVALVALLMVAAWFAVFPADASVTSDDGAYAIEVLELERSGSFSVPHVIAQTDRTGRVYPYVNSSITEEGFFPGARHAAWVRALAFAHSLGDVLGMRALVAVGLAVSVATTAAIARDIHGGDSRLVAGALALTSPLLFHGLQLWAHVWVVAAVAAMMFATLRLARSGPRPDLILLAVVAAGGAAALRGDGLIFSVAVAAALAFVGLRGRKLATGVTGAGLVCAAIASYAASAAYATSIVGSAAATKAATNRADESSSAAGAVGGRIEGVLQTFFSTSYSPGAFVLLVLAVALTAVGVVAVRQGDGDRAAMFVWLAAAVWVVRSIVFPADMASGLIGAWPVVLILFTRRRRDLQQGEKQLLVAVAIAYAGIALTQYDQGGGLNWGGRFIAPSIPALAVLIAGGFAYRAPRLPQPFVRSAIGLVIIIFTSVLVFDASLRTDHDGVVESVAAVYSVPVVTGHPAIPRLAWRTYPDVQWLLLPPDDSRGASTLRRTLARAGIDQVVLYGVTRRDAEQLTGLSFEEDVQSPTRVEVR